MNKIGIICAIEKELRPYLDVLENASTKNYAMLAFHEGFIGKAQVVALFCGVCKVNAAIAAQIFH